MAKLIGVCRDESCHFGTRQLPLVVDDTLTLVMQFTDACMACNNHNTMKNKDIEAFIQKYRMLDQDELNLALMATSKEIFSMLSQVVPCVGCRRSVERLFQQLVDCGHPALEPLVITSDSMLTVNSKLHIDYKALCAFFHMHGPKLNSVIDSIPKSKKNRRCLLHSLDLQRINRPMGNWIEVWELMSRECQEEVVIVEAEMLLDTLDTYLRKHRFCTECKSKVMRAYNILIGEVEPSKEKGYLPGLYKGIKCCPPERHVHILGDTEFLSHLIVRAEPELKGGYDLCSRLERHAKTIEMAQEEVLTCLGLYLYERLHRIWQRLQEMEQIWQILFYVGVDCLNKNFELSIEEKRGYSQLELLCEEISKAEKAKELKKELKRQKKKKKKEVKAKLENEEKENVDDEQDNEDAISSKSSNSSHSPCSQTRGNVCTRSPSGCSACKLTGVITTMPSEVDKSDKCRCSNVNCDNDNTCSRRYATSPPKVQTDMHSSQNRTVEDLNSLSQCRKCSKSRLNNVGKRLCTGNVGGYYSSDAGTVNRCESHDDCLECSSGGGSCNSSDICSHEGDTHSCHSDQSLESLSSGTFSDSCASMPCNRCCCAENSIQNENHLHQHQLTAPSILHSVDSNILPCCSCTMCSSCELCSETVTLQNMLLKNSYSNNEAVISAEDIQQFHEQQPQVSERRQQLRRVLKQRFANFRSSASNLNTLISIQAIQ